MLNSTQINRVLDKQKHFVERLEPLLFQKIDTVPVSAFETFDKLDAAPKDGSLYRNVKPGDVWGAEKEYGWFRFSYTVPAAFAGVKLYLFPEYAGYEALLFVNGVPYANYAAKICVGSHGNHYCKAFAQNPRVGETYAMELEAYAGHDFEGTQPFEEPVRRNYRLTLGEFKICVKDELITRFYYDYKTLRELYEVLPDSSFRKAELTGMFLKLHRALYYSIDDVEKETFRKAIAQGIEIMRPVLAKHNAETVPAAGIIGHSHMDTAWLWEIDETIKKCARTFGNQMNLMDQFPDYHFMQSSAFHLKLMQEHYPLLFKKIRERIAEGRYEPNGGVWVECDCNIIGGEFLIRQFLWGQRFTKKNFGYVSNVFFLPDTFGYSAALPQILQGVGIRYFLTTKMGWNDTNKFPYETYYWEGIDGTRVLAHHNVTHCWPSPANVTRVLNDLSEKHVSSERLVTFGFGDGGGGPEDAMLEMASRIGDLEGCPRVYHTTVSDFMKKLERTAEDVSVYRGELYLEGHRGTLTNQHTIKRNNRKAETAIRNAELFTVMDGVENGTELSAGPIAPLVETLLVNQFHDILPGTCLPEVHDRSIRETGEIIRKATGLTAALMENGEENWITVVNPLSFSRNDVMEVQTDRYLKAGCGQQQVEKADGSHVLRLSSISLQAFESKPFELTSEGPDGEPSPFRYENRVLQTPFARVAFDENGAIRSFVDLKADRELRGNSCALNTFLFGEDVSAAWDNWDIDADIEMKLSNCLKLIKLEVAGDGPVEFRLRATYELSQKSRMVQDMVFYADNPRVDFETILDWNERHRLLKAAFDTSVRADYAVQEIQYGNVKRTTSRNNSIEQARFEVCNHKYTDLSEPRYGVAVLNDCKYGVSVKDSCIALTLHKGGCKPDPRADSGRHVFTYSFLPHQGAFCAENTIHEGYCLNNPALAFHGKKSLHAFLKIDAPNVIAEAVKPCEDAQKAFILRLYEAEGSGTRTKIHLGFDCKVYETDLLEQEKEEIPRFNDTVHAFRPFQIRTFKVIY